MPSIAITFVTAATAHFDMEGTFINKVKSYSWGKTNDITMLPFLNKKYSGDIFDKKFEPIKNATPHLRMSPLMK